MELARYIHIRHWNTEDKKFQSTAFQPSTEDQGISVVRCPCVAQDSGDVCMHGFRYYLPEGITSSPPIFWQFDQGILPRDCKLVDSPGPRGDPCHSSIIGFEGNGVPESKRLKVAKKEAKDFFAKRREKPADLVVLICATAGARALTASDHALLDQLKAADDARLAAKPPQQT